MNRRCLPLLLTALLVARAPAETDWLTRALSADRAVARSGVQEVAVYPSSQPVTSTVAFANDGDGHARREHRSGPSRGLVVISEGGYEWHRAAGDDTWRRVVPLSDGDLGLGRSAARIRANYKVTAAAGEDVAGRATVKLELAPKRAGRPSRRLWVDRETGLMLRSEVFNRDKQLIGRTVTQAIKFARPPAAEVRIPKDAKRDTSPHPGALVRVESMAELERRLGREVWQPTELPAGFRLDATFLRACRAGGWTPVTTFSDGVSVVTLMETAGRGQGRRRRYRGGRECRIQPSRLQVVVRIDLGAGEAVLVGDLDDDELETMARSVRR